MTTLTISDDLNTLLQLWFAVECDERYKLAEIGGMFVVDDVLGESESMEFAYLAQALKHCIERELA